MAFQKSAETIMRVFSFNIPAVTRFKIILGIALLLFCMNGICQLSKIDSLKTVIHKTSTKAARMEAIFALCQQQESLHADTLYVYALQAKQLATA